MSAPTQTKRPWRTTVRTIFQAVVAGAAAAPEVYQAATHHDAATATGWAGAGLAGAAALTRVMALPVVDDFLARFAPFLATQPGGTSGDVTSVWRQILGKA
jgi:hypothetical protein